jgi:hypothetical protein
MPSSCGRLIGLDDNLVNSLAELDALGVAFISFGNNLDLSTPSERLMFQIIGAMDEFERALIWDACARDCECTGKEQAPRALNLLVRIDPVRTPNRTILILKEGKP